MVREMVLVLAPSVQLVHVAMAWFVALADVSGANAAPA